MRVLLISFSELPTLQNLLYVTQGGLTAHGVDCWTIGSKRLTVDHVMTEKNLLVETPESPKPSVSSMRAMGGALKNLLALIDEVNPDVIHFTNKHTWNYFLCRRLRRCRPSTLLFHTFHDPLGHSGDAVSRGVVLYHRLVQRLLDGIVVMSSKARTQAEDGLHPRCPVFQIPFGEKEWLPFEPLSPCGDGRRVLIFGRINPYKGVEYWQRIADELLRMDSSLTLVIAGKRSDDVGTDALVGIAAMPNVELEDRFIEDSELRGYFWGSALVLMPYTSITQSGVLLDAYRHGRAVVAFDIDGMAQNVPNAANLVKPFDCEAFAARVVSLCSDSESLLWESKLAWDFGREFFSTEKMVAELIASYQMARESQRAQ